MDLPAPFPDRHRWPVTLNWGPLRLRPLRRRDARDWELVRARNAAWLRPWDATWPPGEPPALRSFAAMVRQWQRQARDNRALPWVLDVDGRLAGHVSVSSITLGSARQGQVGYWIDERYAGRGLVPAAVALGCDYAFQTMGLHRIEVAIRPENEASLRVVAKLGFREEGLRPAYLHIDGAWRDHRVFALNCDEVGEGLVARCVPPRVGREA